MSRDACGHERGFVFGVSTPKVPLFILRFNWAPFCPSDI